jgi:hypothetical protein
MPWYEGNIPAFWEAALERKTGGKIAVEVVLDPDSAAIALDGDHDIVDVAEIGQERDLDIEQGGMAYIPDVALTFNDLDNYFDPDNTASPFHQCEGEVKDDLSAGATTIRLISWPEVVFAAGEVLIISDVAHSETVTAGSFTSDDGSSGYHELVIDSGLAHDYAAGSRIHTAPIAGKQLLVRLVNLTESTPEKITIFQGEITKDPEVSCGQAVITCADARKRMLDTNLAGADSDDTKKLMVIGTDGQLINSIAWDNDFYQPPLTFEIVDGALPAGTSINAESGELSGTPAESGTFTFTIRATNAAGESKEQDCTLTVYDRINEDFESGPGLSDFEEIAGEDVPGWVADEPSLSAAEGYCRIGATNQNNVDLMWDGSVLAIACYNMLAVASPGSLAGDFCLLARIDGANFTGSSDLQMGLAVTTVGDESIDFGFTLGFDGNYQRLAAIKREDLNTVGAYSSGTVVTDFRIRKVSGTYYFYYRLSGSSTWVLLGSRADAQVVKYVGLAVCTDLNTGTTGDKSVDVDYFRAFYGALAVTTASLPISREAHYYNHALRASGGAGEYAWTVTTGNLPAGLELDSATGIISGYQAANGSTTFTVTVTDGAGATATKELTITASAENEMLPDIRMPADKNQEYEDQTNLYVGGMLDRSQVVIGSRCPVGQWIFLWASATAFTATPPGLTPFSGEITEDFEIANIITIPAAAWTAGMAKDDQMTFVTGITWINENPVQMIYDLQVSRVGLAPKQIDASAFFGDIELGLVTAYDAVTGYTTIGVTLPALLPALDVLDFGGTLKIIYAGNSLAASWPPAIAIKTYLPADFTGFLVTWIKKTGQTLNPEFSYDREYEYCRDADILISLTLDRSMTVAQAIEAICQHAGLMQYHHFGLECLHTMRPRLQSAVHEFTEADIKADVRTEALELVNVITVKYAYDYVSQEYLGSYTYPPSAAENPSYRRYGKEVAKTIYCPGIYSAEQAQLAAQRKYEQYAAGLQLVTINCDLRSLLMRIGERWDIDIDDPDICGRFETIRKRIAAIGSRNVALTGYNSSVFDKFALADSALADVHCAW